MKGNIASHILKGLLILFAFGAIFLGAYVLPTMAEEIGQVYPELEYAKSPTLIGCESLLLLLIGGLGIIMYLLILFDKGKTFSRKFVKGLEILTLLSIVASLGVIGIFLYFNNLGGPGPLVAMVMVAAVLIIWIVAAVMMLIRNIVKKAILYKDDYDLTV